MIRRVWQSVSVLTMGITLSCLAPLTVRAASPDSAPAALVQTLDQIEVASNQRDLEAVINFYSPNFTNTDGFNRSTLESTLSQFWQQYSGLTYRIELQSWEATTTGFVAETITYIQGTLARPERNLTLEAVVRSRQHFENGQIVSQEILSERNSLSGGDNPPTMTVLLPEQVRPRQPYSFDAIVQEPLGDSYLLGAALEEGTTADDFLTARPLNFELLSAGGLFKVGDGSGSDDSRWVSAIVVREDGMVIVTRRLRVEE